MSRNNGAFATDNPTRFRSEPFKRGDNSIDRNKICPFLLRVFLSKNHFHSENSFTLTQTPTQDEILLYAWKDTTLRELFHLLKEEDTAIQNPDARLEFKIVYLDRSRERYITRQFGSVHGTRHGPDDLRTLAQGHFPGDMIDICISIEPLSAPNPPVSGGSGVGHRRPIGNTHQFSGGPRRSHDHFDSKRQGRNAPYPPRTRHDGRGSGFTDRRHDRNQQNTW
ncbi:Sin3 associated polypeptide p18-domain-containing protein [Syncephalis fuscata]|nr:Sin3 associated polypeptide p18-domain-containing protein [Syncephalis fuscata]